MDYGLCILEIVNRLRLNLPGEKDLTPGREAHAVVLLDSGEASARKLEICLRSRNTRARGGQDVVRLFDVEHHVLDGAIEHEVRGDELLARAALRRAAATKIEKVITDFDLR